MTNVNDFNANLIDEFRTHDGNVTGGFEHATLLLLTTTGAKSGHTHTSPVVFTRDGDHYVVIASRGGAPKHPAWYHNLVANPSVTVEVPGETFEANARVATGEERERLWRAHADLMPTFDQYQARTTRQIPVVVLERV